MEFIKRKSVLITLCVLIGTLVFSAFSLAVFNIFEKSKEEQSHYELGVQAADLTISDLAGLKAFASNTDSFYGKLVVLSADIDCGGERVNKDHFSGTFDGQGYAIKNLYVKDQDVTWSNEYGGFFQMNTGTIKNTKFINSVIFVGANNYAQSGNIAYVGIIAGDNRGTIENCIVTNVEATTNNYRNNTYIAALVGVNCGGVVQDCLVEGTFNVHSKNGNFIANPDGAYVYPFVCEQNTVIGAPLVTCCVFSATYTESGDNTDYITENFEDNPLGYTSKSYTSNKNDGFVNLGSNLSEGGGDSGWYYASDYKDWPYLKKFITWQEITFSADRRFEIDLKSIKLPSDYSNFDKHNNSTVPSITLGDQTITATPTDSSYNFIEWVYSSYSYTVVGDVISFNLLFKYNELAKLTIFMSGLEEHTEDLHTVGYGGNFFNIVIQKYAVSFGYGRNVRYEVVSGYMIDYVTINGKKYTSNTTFGLVEDLEIEIYIVPKTWNTIFK